MDKQKQPVISARIWLSLTVRTALFPVAILWPAGDWLWWDAWMLIGIWMVFFVALTTYLLRRDPALLVERMNVSPAQKGQKGWDKAIMLLMFVLAIAIYTVPGLDVIRFGWSQSLPQWLKIIALLAHLPCFLFLGWVMHENTYLYPVVKIDHEREHQVITSGPYAIVRHPMYSIVIVLSLAFPVALGSRFGLIPALLIILLFIVRTILEDRTLHDELPGYPEYAGVTRYRLIPGVW
ncbi:MAG: isoprenylcysteine carboxylmethyltransferase family protein [Pseudomonadota bacterium]